ncbi:MAG: enoyl-CoA hydratase-related protein, partial [Paracoccus sp. (in: a-proteobacteria)]|nr:enoyl-CoA hydratase-related protein [Paracoccus sp. (in: a-proteobacteria)]
MSEADKVLFCTEGPVAIITLNRPAQRNAIDADTCRGLRAAFDRIETEPDLRIAVLEGAGPIFCAGMDLKAFVNGEAEEILFGPGRFGGLVSRSRSKPVIASVQGAALAGGFELMLACDMVVAAKGTLFGLPEARRGLVAGAGGAFRVGQLLPKAIANEILLTGAPFDADLAAARGLVNRVVEGEPLGAALELAREIAANAPLSLGASLQLARAAAEENAEALWEQNDRLLRQMIASDDAE